MRIARTAAVLAVGFALAAFAAPKAAEACGGFFCSQTPIDQSAERIIFAQNGEDVISYVQVAYSGAAEDFAWVVPVSSIPEVETAEATLFQLFDQLTSVSITPPNCLMNQMFDSATGGGDPAPNAESRDEDGVTVFSSGEAGPYHYDVVGSENAQLLINWLNDNNYIITSPMEPMVEHYVSGGQMFLAMKLQADQGVDALKPVKLTFEGDNAVVPIRLTAVAADPHMGIIVWMLGDSRAVSANFANVELDQNDIRFDFALRNNYRTVVSRTVDAAGGHAFITEFAGSTTELAEMSWDEEATVLLQSYPYLTRLYTTMSPEEMTADPMFTFNANLGDVSRFIDLSDREDLCEEESSPCDFIHCGGAATCYEVNGAAACECPDGMAARGVTDPVLGTSVTCVPEDRNMLGDEIPSDPCASVTCGEFGQCLALDGEAACACDDGYGASDDLAGSVECTSLEDAIVVIGPVSPDVVPEIVANGDSPAGEEAGCSVSSSNGGALSSFALFGLVLGLVTFRRRRV